MIEFKYTIMGQGRPHVFKNLADAWKFADDNGLERCERVQEKDKHPFQRGPVYWEKHLMFWHSNEPGKKRYSQKEVEYYDNWLSEMFANEKVNTKLQTGLQ